MNLTEYLIDQIEDSLLGISGNRNLDISISNYGSNPIIVEVDELYPSDPKVETGKFRITVEKIDD